MLLLYRTIKPLLSPSIVEGSQIKNMLSTEEIKQIGEEMGKVIEDNINPQFESINQQFGVVNSRLDKIEATMVTKDYLDEKLGDLRGDLVILMRKEDTKLKSLVDILRAKQLLNDDEVKKIYTMEPFPQLL